MPASSDHDPAASGARCSRATRWPGRALAAASMKPRTISSGVAPGSGGSGSMPTVSAGREGAWVICTVADELGTVEQAETASSSARTGPQRAPVGRVMPAPRGGGGRPGAVAAANW